MLPMNSELVLYQLNGIQSKREAGYIFPVTIFMSILLSAFLLHQIESFRLEKLFYHETNQQMELEAMMKYTWDTIRAESLMAGNNPYPNYIFPTGVASVTSKDLDEKKEIMIICSTTEGREYKATIIYDMGIQEVIAWYETN